MAPNSLLPSEAFPQKADLAGRSPKATARDELQDAALPFLGVHLGQI